MVARVGALLVIGFLATSLVKAQPPATTRPPRATLGVEIQQGGAEKGIVVQDVDPEGPAAKAGLKRGDMIVRVGDKDVSDYNTLVDMLRKHKPGDKLSVKVMRDGKEHMLDVTLGERRVRPSPRTSGEAPRENGPAFLGVATQPLTPEMKSQLKAEEGVLVTQVGPETPASRAGIRRGDVITKVNGKAIGDPEQLRESVRSAHAGQELTLSVVRDGKSQDIKVHAEQSPGESRFGLPSLPPGVRSAFEGFPTIGDDRQTIQRLEQRIQELEKRVRELEKKETSSGK